MASAGRILIIPKGNYNAETKYEMLDLVFHNGTSWLAKKDAVGIEPSDSEESKVYWFKMCESTDITVLEQRIAAIENQLLSVANLDEIDLSDYATKAEVNAVSEDVALLEETVGGLSEDVGGLKTLADSLSKSFGKVQVLSYTGNGTFGPDNPCSVTADFAPKILMHVGEHYNYKDIVTINAGREQVILCEHLTTTYSTGRGFNTITNATQKERYAKKSEDGKTIYWYIPTYEGTESGQLNGYGHVYYFIAIG